MDPKEWTNIIEKVAHITSGEGSAVSPQSSHSGKKPDNPNKVRQAVYDIRYKARTDDVPLETAFSQYIGRSGLGSQEKEEVKKKLFGEEVVNEVLSPAEADTLRRKREQQKRNRVVKQRAAQKSLENDDQKLRDIAARMRADEYDPTLDEEKAKYKVRVQDKSGKKHYKMLDRNKIADARRDPDVSSVEMTKYGKLDAVGKEDGDVNNDGKKDSQDSYLLNRRKAIGKAMKKEGLDPVGKEDGDVNNDGKKDGTDKYLLNRRKKIGDAIKNASKMKEEKDYGDKEKVMQKAKPLHKHLYKNLHKGDKDGDVNEALKPRIARQPLSSWRNDLVEVIGEKEPGEKKFDIKKGIKNKVVINPKLGESIEEIGGTLMEVIEFDEFDYMVEGVYAELIEEGYSEDDVESAIERALIEAKVTVGHDTEGPKAERTRDKLKKTAKGFLGKVAVKAYNKARDVKSRMAPTVQRAKTSAKRGVRKMALKVADKLKEENVDEAVYGGTPEKKKDTRMVVTNADKKANTPAYQKMKAGDKRYKAADHMEEVEVDEAMRPGERQRKMAAKRHDPYVKGGSKTRGQAHNIAVRGDVSTGDPAIKSRGGGGVKKDKGMGYGDRGAGNKARRRAGQEPMRGSRDPRNEGYAPGDVDQKLKTDRNMFTIPKKDQEAAKQRLLAKAKAKQVKEGDGDPCWDSHKQVGMKKKGGRMVPNCVPKNEELSIDQQMKISRDHNRKSPEEKKAANRKALGVVKKVKREKDTRTDAQKMADAYASPRKGPGGATRAD